MNSKSSKPLVWLIALTVIASIVLAACNPQPAAPTSAPQATQAQPAAQATQAQPTAKPTEPPKAQGVVNRAGVKLPADAAPIEKQVMRYAESELKWLTWDASVYDENTGDIYAWADSCARPDRDYVPQPNACEKWETSKDGLT